MENKNGKWCQCCEPQPAIMQQRKLSDFKVSRESQEGRSEGRGSGEEEIRESRGDESWEDGRRTCFPCLLSQPQTPLPTLSPRLSLWITHPESRLVGFMFALCCYVCCVLVAELHLWASSACELWSADSWSENVAISFITQGHLRSLKSF